MNDAQILRRLTEVPRHLVPIDLLPYDLKAEIEAHERAGLNVTVFEVDDPWECPDHPPMIIVAHAEKIPPMAAIRKAYLEATGKAGTSKTRRGKRE